MKKWRYKTDQCMTFSTPELQGVEFKNEWIEIKDGQMTIQKDYAWDGCSPAWNLYGDTWYGVPDGPLGEDGRPVTWLATLLHDALCQFRKEIKGITKRMTVDLFARCLKDSKAPFWIQYLYPPAVDLFGPQKWG